MLISEEWKKKKVDLQSFFYLKGFFFLFRIKQLEKLPELKPIEKESEVVLKFPEVEKLAGSILILSEVAYAYPECKPTFQNVDLSATMESRICIVSF